MAPLVSVVIPSYNHELFICDAIESVLAQSYSNFELIIIDDGSTDNTLDKINSYKSDKVRIIAQENQGAHAAINNGIHLSKGEFVTVLNSDDIYHHERLERLVEHALNSGKEFVFTGLSMIDGQNNPYKGARWGQYQDLHGQCIQHSDAKIFLLGNIAYTTSNFFFRKELLKEVGDFKKLRFTHDWNWLLRCTLIAEPSWLQQDLLTYRVHETNTLNESMLWYSILEDSYNFSCYHYGLLSKEKMTMQQVLDMYLALLINNVSYIPFFVNLFLSLLMYKVVQHEDELLDYIQDESFGDRIKSLIESTKYENSTFHSLYNINSIVKGWRAQTEMIQERDECIRKCDEMVQERDDRIARLETGVSSLKDALQSTIDYRIKKIIKNILRK